ncbi:MAG TPA: HD domain-containing protein [Nanoarchaeota archaeon]|nr:HD domain-containing protein [Candidatus Pacearchaeota archaeon]HIH18144.1 HD domain-containing protein [Nanoarchaeota archaeon]HIH34121.1 HD domain-containing protein [Nanoarchaeota archaeon]HIH51299.1 HD domain-containing protein [Nanoarchaeota archaeon]HIH65638.1 HD domain-containing protein [Nanoarchaeota archaeon]
MVNQLVMGEEFGEFLPRIYRHLENYVLNVVYGEPDKALTLGKYFHNKEHVTDVRDKVTKLSELEGVPEMEMLLLQIGALLHDTGHLQESKNHEDYSIRTASEVLSFFGFPKEYKLEVFDLIDQTRFPQKPYSHLGEMLCDADLNNLGNPSFFDWGERLRREQDLPRDYDWYKRQLSFLEGHEYHTETAKRLWDSGKRYNISLLKIILSNYDSIFGI